MVISGMEVVYTHNFGFRPTGVMRDAYVSHLTSIYARNGDGYVEDVSALKLIEISNWLRAWQFMEMCGFTSGDSEEEFDVAGEGGGLEDDVDYHR